MPWEKVLVFLKSHRAVKKPENNSFRVPIDFATNRLTFEKFPPRPPLLHPIRCTRQHSHTGYTCRKGLEVGVSHD